VISGQSVVINGTVTGDARVTGGSLTINSGGVVQHDVVMTNGSVTVYGTVHNDVKAQSGNVTVYGTVGKVEVTNGSVTISGTVTADVQVQDDQIQNGYVTLNSTAWVGGNVDITHATLNQAPGSYVGGNVTVH